VHQPSRLHGTASRILRINQGLMDRVLFYRPDRSAQRGSPEKKKKKKFGEKQKKFLFCSFFETKVISKFAGKVAFHLTRKFRIVTLKSL
jgi:hypothetical protein